MQGQRPAGDVVGPDQLAARCVMPFRIALALHDLLDEGAVGLAQPDNDVAGCKMVIADDRRLRQPVHLDPMAPEQPNQGLQLTRIPLSLRQHEVVGRFSLTLLELFAAEIVAEFEDFIAVAGSRREDRVHR